MDNFLVDHAIKKVWCSPNQDNQIIIRAKRVSKNIGSLNYISFMNRNITLPVKNKRYHIFNVGQVTPTILGLLGNKPNWVAEKWIKFSDAVNSLKLFCNIYINSGLEIPRFKTYYMFTNDKSLIFAIEENSNLSLNFQEESIYVRLYTNAYYETIRADKSTEYIYTEGSDINNLEDGLAIQTKCSVYRAKEGYVYCYVNGLFVDDLNLVTIKVGDIVEFVYDSSVKKVVTFTVNNLKKFHSLLDTKYKYLLHYENSNEENIEYQDDVDIHVTCEYAVNKFRGLYFNRNLIDSHRMVTHRDYSIPVDYFTFVSNSLVNYLRNNALNVLNFKIQVKIRDSGYKRSLVQENERIFELYKLNDQLVSDALVGIDSTVPEWTASYLENSNYTKIMRSSMSDITSDLVKKAYGYNAISKLTADTPAMKTNTVGNMVIELPYLHQLNSTMYEYDANGHMLDYNYHSEGINYIASDSRTVYIEGICGKGSDRLDTRYGSNNIELIKNYNFKVYKCEVVGGAVNNDWKDVTNSSFYTIIDNHVVWTGDEGNQYLMVRFDSSFLAYDLTLRPVQGDFKFILTEVQNKSGTYQNQIMDVPLGSIDLFLNGKSLIAGIDYKIIFPEIQIINLTHLNNPINQSEQKLHIRFTGFCNSNFEMESIEDYGFIEHGVLSNNFRYNLRDDKVLRITVNGGLKHRSELLFSEEHSGISILNPTNGSPYQIKDILVPLKSVINEDSYILRDKSKEIDKRISNYLSLKIPQPSRPAISVIQQQYPVVSPFLSYISYELNEKRLPVELFTNKLLSDNQILTMCKPYEHLLKFDPIYNNDKLDRGYVLVHPHNLLTTLTVSLGQFKFLRNVVRLYFDSSINLTPFFTVDGL